MSVKDTTEFRALLDEERERIVSAIGYLHEDHQSSMEEEVGEVGSSGAGNHLGDMASITFDRELDEGLEEGAQQTLEQIDRALAKIEDGTYGTCERCGGEIGEERLRARPWALLCIDDQRLAGRG